MSYYIILSIYSVRQDRRGLLLAELYYIKSYYIYKRPMPYIYIYILYGPVRCPGKEAPAAEAPPPPGTPSSSWAAAILSDRDPCTQRLTTGQYCV